MLIELELNINDAEALLRHCDAYKPSSGECREDSRLRDALETLASAIREGMGMKESMESVDPRLLGAAINLFGDTALALNWLSKPVQALGGKRPLDAHIEEALALLGKLAHGFDA
jgi:hypothetical protein